MNKISSSSLDFIGDIHGHADELIELLEKLGYSNSGGFYQHPSRKVFFCGDFIDRGPKVKEVLQIVKGMIDNGAAYTVIGNHEYNAICYHTIVDGKPLRGHSHENAKQHRHTLEALAHDELQEYISWFKTLPIYHDNGSFKIVHAQWEQEYVNQLQAKAINDFSDERFLIESANKSAAEYKLVDCLLKGREIQRPGIYFRDKGGKKRNVYRIKWWKQGKLLSKDALFEFPQDNDEVMPFELMGIEKSVPLFFGHYCLKDEKPVLQSNIACCLDFCVAKNGLLAAYRWDGEQELVPEKFCCVESRDKQNGAQ